jgi:ribosome-binding factor A
LKFHTKTTIPSLYLLLFKEKTMDTTRQNKIAKLIQKELAEIFLADGIPVYDCMITVTQTKVTPDLSLARSYLSIFNAEDNEVVMNAVKKNSRDIRYRLGQKVKHQLRVIPQLDFFIDDSLDYLENIENLLKS